jgi:hypothetical protein
MNHEFTDNMGGKYLVFDRYKRNPTTRALIKEPMFNLSKGQEYYIKGVKGEFNPKWRTTSIDRASLVSQNNTQSTQNRVEEPIVEEPVVTEPVKQEAPVAVQPPKVNILSDDKREEILKKVNMISERAKSVVTNGKTNDVTDEWGNVIKEGKEMSPEELIPLYISQIEKLTKFDTEEWNSKLLKSFNEDGKDGLINQINLIPKILRNTL